MADNRNFAALDWLIHEIGETLKEARQALEAYVENPKDSVRIRFCLTHIHQVHGSLQMVEFFGAAMLAEEMERLTQAMIQDTVANVGEAQEVLMRAILQFPVYLEQVKTTRKDNPLIVLPLLNDLRAVRGEALLTDTKLFVPNLAPAKKITGARSPATQDTLQFQAMALKLRQMYQYAAAGFIRSVNNDENLAYLEKVFSRLYKLTQGTARHALWDICLALVEALETDALEISASVKSLLRQLDKEINVLALDGTQALNSYTNDELIKNLLYYVARAGKYTQNFKANSHLQRICDAYHLADALIEGKESSDSSMLSSPDPEALRSVVSALKVELDVIKYALNMCLSGENTQKALDEALPVVKRIADTMAVLGLGDLRKQVLEYGAALELMAHSSSQLTNTELMSVAGKVIEIEDALDSLAQTQNTNTNIATPSEGDITLTRAKESVLRESRNGLEHAKDAIIEYIASQWDRKHLQSVPATLREIRGGLDILPLPRAARILGACARYIEEQLLTQVATPQWATLDTLADAITSVEYYLERLSSGATSEENDLLLVVAEESVASLGYAVAKTIRSDVAVSVKDQAVSNHYQPSLARTHTVTTEAAETDEANLSAAYQTVFDESSGNTNLEEYAPVEADVLNDLNGNDSPTSIETVQENTHANVQTDIENSITSDIQEFAPQSIDQQADCVELEAPTTVELSTPSAISNLVDDDNYIDEEIIEIFIEEAGEVLGTIAHYFPLWVNNINDLTSLTEFRRAFHTLKGSGRMVGANDIGELSWSIESMLNRILDKTIEPSQPHFTIVEKVREILPSMVQAFSLHHDNPHPVLSEHYRAMAESLCKGIVPEELIVTADATQLASDKELDEVDATETETTEIAAIDIAEDNTAIQSVDVDVDADHALTVMPSELSDETDENYIFSREVMDEIVDDVDMQLWDIFGAEALTHLHVIEEFIARMDAEAPCYEPPNDSIQRALHTLKGSAYMAEILSIAEIAGPLEKLTKELRNYQLNINDDILQLLRDAVTYIHQGLVQISQGEMVEIPRLSQFIARVNELYDIHIEPLVHQQALDENGKRQIDPALLSIFMEEEMNLLLDADKVIAQWQALPDSTTLLQPVVDELSKLTQAACHAYLLPMANLGDTLTQVYTKIIAQQLPCSESLCSTLNLSHLALLDMVDAVAAGQNLADAPAIIQTALDELLKSPNDDVVIDALAMSDDDNEYAETAEYASHTLIAEESELNVIDTDSYAIQVLGNMARGNDEILLLDDIAEDEIETYNVELVTNDESTNNTVVADEYAIGDEEILLLDNSELTADDVIEQEDLVVDMVDDDIFNEAVVVSELNVVDETLALEEFIEEETIVEDLESYEMAFTSADSNNNSVVIDNVENLATDDVSEAFESALLEPLLENVAIDEVADELLATDTITPEQLLASPDTPIVQTPVITTITDNSKTIIAIIEDEDFDPEIVEIFIEEALELLEDMERALHTWQEDWSSTEPAEELKRCLHTFKGGARLAGLTELGDLSHEFETLLIDMDSNTDINQILFKQLNDFQDQLHAGVGKARIKLSADYMAADSAAQQQWHKDHISDVLPEPEVTGDVIELESNIEVDSLLARKPTLVVDNTSKLAIDYGSVSQKPNVLTFAPKPKPVSAPLPKIPGMEFGGMRQGGPAQVQHLASRRVGPQEVVKVSAELLEELVNLAGETSISRGRMEQQVSDLGSAIGEMDSTIQRLQEQLRRLDIETEAQVAFRQEKMAQHEDFDPLEMDRYSQLQQLSRSLIESASDLMDLKFTLADKTRDTETLLLQQSRINTDLQEGLMRSRMVPFSRLVPRLRRIVRQAAAELGKEVDFELDNVEGELDRTVLERMVAPLEHMLRNAVDHGIESLSDRTASGKPAAGRIVLSLSREGGDVMLRLSDDGRGINLERVRAKAIERGLMSNDVHLNDQDLMQFILHAGFSTADKVTQISGRGVGMDVVYSEIKQLGGAMFIDSRWGEGTEFIIRLPFTVSVNRALMVQIGDDLYAIPLNTIEGIVRVSPFELEHYYLDQQARFDYAGENYLVRYLGAMLDSDAQPKLDGQSLPLPVILVRSAENTVALQVDRLLGSREIVVKTLGAQFSAVSGLSGATVMGDGSVVVILDLHALIREQLALGIGRSMLLEPQRTQPLIEPAQIEKVIMVVDDSVTVRKVTSRFLEREGYSVIAAKDGVEALQLLQDRIPDVMLLDIEMPRMDGFEVAKNIRTSSRLKDIPIIMITSRTGDKHRDRALELGVNKYMGKPYQEDLLLTNIQELMTKSVK